MLLQNTTGWLLPQLLLEIFNVNTLQHGVTHTSYYHLHLLCEIIIKLLTHCYAPEMPHLSPKLHFLKDLLFYET
jgi:hypothetical protein